MSIKYNIELQAEQYAVDEDTNVILLLTVERKDGDSELRVRTNLSTPEDFHDILTMFTELYKDIPVGAVRHAYDEAVHGAKEAGDDE